MLLAIDIGNTHVKIGAFNGPRLAVTWRVVTDAGGTADEYAVWIGSLLRREGLAFHDFDGCVIGSVVPAATHALVGFAERYLGRPPLVVHAGLRLGLRVRYWPTGTLGADRLAAVVAARHRYGAPVLAVTLGTATTFNVVSPAGDFAGGAIAPGIVMAAEALHLSTARLPLVDLVAPPRVIGRNSDESVRAGVMYGFAGLIEGMVHRLKATIGPPGGGTLGGGFPVVATGGLARVIAPLTTVIDVVDDGLMLDGLRLVWEMNQ